MTTLNRPAVLSRAAVMLFAVASGAAVANLYWAQPLLEIIGRDFGASPAMTGWIVTLAQVGYALGVVLIVPLGDIVDRRHLIPAMMLLAALALLACALAPSIGVLLVATSLLGVATVSGQLLIPLAGDLSRDAERGKVSATVVSGLLIGILASRTISGFVAELAGWRVIYIVAAGLAVVLALLLSHSIPSMPPRVSMRYPRLLLSVWETVRQERSVRWTLLMGATAFAAFTMFWTALVFHLSAAPFNYSVAVIGLFGLAGVTSAVAAQRAGRLHDRGWSVPATGWGWVGILAAFIVAALGGNSVVMIIAAIVLLDIAAQGVNVLNQMRLFADFPHARSRVNTAFVTGNFIGGAAGSAAAALLWTAGGWTAVAGTGAGLALIGLCTWALGRRGLRG